jgi:hypothetical protein
MELIEAVEEQDWEKVKVRRPLEAVSGTEYGPSRGVCMGLGRWTPRCRRTPDSALLCRVQPPASGNFDVACRRSSGKVTTTRSLTGTHPCRLCRISQFLAASFARNGCFRDFPKFGTFAGCASGERDGDYSESSRSTLYR